VRRPETSDVIGDRALGTDPLQVAALGRATLEGMARGGVLGCLKHMPGHGRATVDSHKEMPVVHASEAELEEDIAPFRALSGHPLGMTGHLMFPAWDGEHPATQSPTIVEDVIRGAIGFDGLLLTDDIDMEALEGSVPERSECALAAGCDVTLNCWAKMPDMEGIAARNPDLSDSARARFDRVMDAIGPMPEGFETADLIARRDAFFAAARDAA